MMQLATMQLLAKYPKLTGLSDMLNLKAKDIRKEDVVRLAEAFNITISVNDELVDAFVALLRGKNIHAVADIIQSPDSVGEIIAFVKGGFSGVQAVRSNGYTEDAQQLFLK